MVTHIHLASEFGQLPPGAEVFLYAGICLSTLRWLRLNLHSKGLLPPAFENLKHGRLGEALEFQREALKESFQHRMESLHLPPAFENLRRSQAAEFQKLRETLKHQFPETWESTTQLLHAWEAFKMPQAAEFPQHLHQALDEALHQVHARRCPQRKRSPSSEWYDSRENEEDDCYMTPLPSYQNDDEDVDNIFHEFPHMYQVVESLQLHLDRMRQRCSTPINLEQQLQEFVDQVKEGRGRAATLVRGHLDHVRSRYNDAQLHLPHLHLEQLHELVDQVKCPHRHIIDEEDCADSDLEEDDILAPCVAEEEDSGAPECWVCCGSLGKDPFVQSCDCCNMIAHPKCLSAHLERNAKSNVALTCVACGERYRSPAESCREEENDPIEKIQQAASVLLVAMIMAATRKGMGMAAMANFHM